MILARLLYRHFVHVPEELPKVLGIGEPLPTTAKIVIFMCTNGTLEQENMLSALSRGIDAAANFCLVQLDDDFRFPTASFVREHFELLQRVAGTVSGATALAEAVTDIFKIVALPFHPVAATELVLNSQALNIAERLRRIEKQQCDLHGTPGGALWGSPSGTHCTEGAVTHEHSSAALEATCSNDDVTRRGSWWSNMSTASVLDGGSASYNSASSMCSDNQPSFEAIV
jgi:hypothetical protein